MQGPGAHTESRESREQRAESRERRTEGRAESREQGVESRGQGREHRAESREQGAESREQIAEAQFVVRVSVAEVQLWRASPWDTTAWSHQRPAGVVARIAARSLQNCLL